MKKIVDAYNFPVTEDEAVLKDLTSKICKFKHGDSVFWLGAEESYDFIDCYCNNGKVEVKLPNNESCLINCPACESIRKNAHLLKPIIQKGTVKDILFKGGFFNHPSIKIFEDGTSEENNGSWYITISYKINCSDNKDDRTELLEHAIFASMEDIKELYEETLSGYNEELNNWKECLKKCKTFYDCDLRDISRCACTQCEHFSNCNHADEDCYENLS